MHRSRLLVGGAIIAALAGTAACGLQSLEPKLELRDAMNAATANGSGGFRVSFPSSMADLRTFAEEADKESGGATGDSSSTDSSNAELQKLLSSHLDVAFDHGADAKDPADDAVRALVNIAGRDVADVRSVAQVLYLKVDFAALEAVFPGIKNGVDATRGQLAGPGDGSAESGAPTALSQPVSALLDSRWVSMDTGKDSWLAQQLRKQSSSSGAGAAGTAAAPSPTAKSLLAKAFPSGTVKVARLESDDRLGDHLVAAANLRAVYRNLEPELARIVTAAPGGGKGVNLPPVGGVPNRDGAVSIWVNDGAWTRAELDLAQFLDKPAGHLVVRLDPRVAGTTVAPPGAVPIDMQKITEVAQGPTVTARTVAAFVDEDIRQWATQEGGAPNVQYLDRVRNDLARLPQMIVLDPVEIEDRIQVQVDGDVACLVLSENTTVPGVVTDGPCP